MPTLNSIGVDQSLVDRLAGVGSSSSGGGGGDDNAGSGQGLLIQNVPPMPMPMPMAVPIRTPQSLLSRDPTSVAAALGLSLPEALNLRSAVADAMTARCAVGRDAANIVGDVSESIAVAAARARGSSRGAAAGRKRMRVENQNGGTSSAVEDGACEFTGGDADVGLLLFHRRRPPPAVVGAVTALDLCIHSATVAAAAADEGGGPQVGTGSSKLDSLLSPDADLADGGMMTRIYHSLVLPPRPGRRRHGDDEDGGATAEAEFFGPRAPYQQLGKGGGVRLGYVSEVYGPPSSGKTQLALTVAANAALLGSWNVHYLAAGGGSSSVLPLARRLKSLCLSRLQAAPLSASLASSASASASTSGRAERHRQAMLRAALDRVDFVTVQDGHGALAALAEIETDIVAAAPAAVDAAAAGDNEGKRKSNKAGSSNNNNSNRNNLIIFDSASGCLSSDLYADGDGGLGAALVEDVGFSFRKLARTIGFGNGNHRRRCAVLVVNGASGPKAALGAGWRTADVQVRFDVLHDDYPDVGRQQQEQQAQRQQQVPGLTVSRKRIVKATLMKHYGRTVTAREDDDSRSTTLAITANGIVDESCM